LATTAVSSAAAPSPLWQTPDDGVAGGGAGRLSNPRDVASDPETGHLFVTDGDNSRIDEFTAWGEFVKAWGWGVVDGSPELQICGPATCQAGTEGDGAGQFARPNGIAVDSGGNVYVVDRVNARVQKFDSAGHFLLTFGGEVNKTKVAEPGSSEAEKNLCTAASENECGAGTFGTGQGQFSEWVVGNFIDVGPDDTIYVGDRDRIQIFEPDGTYKGQIALPEEGLVRALTVDPGDGDVYFVFAPEEIVEEVPKRPFIYRHSPTGWEQFAEVARPADAESEYPIHGRVATLAAGSNGEIYAVAEERQNGHVSWEEIVGFDADGKCLEGLCPGDRFDESTGNVGLGTSVACGLPEDALYVTNRGGASSYLQAFGPAPNPLICEPPKAPPVIAAQFAAAAGSDAATVQAQINPKFWSDTTYYVQYGTAACPQSGWEGSECQQAPASPPSLGQAVSFPVNTAPVSLNGLLPQTTYHYRFVAQSGGGGPVFGPDASFTTLPLGDQPNTTCPNQTLRTGASALLPDCRAYELVSPVDKEGGDAPSLTREALVIQVNQAALDGNRFTYSSYRAFAGPDGAPNTSQYLAARDEIAGWTSESIVPPRGLNVIGILESAASEFVAFSPDLCHGWLRHDTDHPPFAPGAVPNFSNFYERENCGPLDYRAITRLQDPVAEPNTPVGNFLPELQGLSTDESCAVFRANGKLTPDASDTQVEGSGVYQVYETCGETIRLVSALPDGSAYENGSSAGTQGKFPNHRTDSVFGAVSSDGSRIYWTATKNGREGNLYVREHADQPQSAIAAGKCTESAKACTYSVSAVVSSANARFLTANADGSLALFMSGGQLYRFNFATKKATLIAGEVAGLLGTSKDLSRIYLVSEEDRDGVGKATAGEPNLYRYQNGPFSFIATLSARDAQDFNNGVSPVNREPVNHTARVTDDGAHLAFMSTASLTGFDNTDLNSGESDAEVFLYSAGTGELACVSCNRAGTRPVGIEAGHGDATPFWVAARLRGWATQFYPTHLLSEDGQRLYFESAESLAPGDINGRFDIYEWEAAGSGDCTEALAAFSQEAGGCVRLISSGKSDRDSVFLDATPSGEDVFFATAESLLVQDPGQIDVYDARIGGGFPPPPAPRVECADSSCQGPVPSPPASQTPSTATAGEGNPPSRERRCRKGKRRVRRHGKKVCIKPHRPVGAHSHRHSKHGGTPR
jgi:sugar lactone lactonase YvrE